LNVGLPINTERLRHVTGSIRVARNALSGPLSQ
jgi:hypothetical protein